MLDGGAVVMCAAGGSCAAGQRANEPLAVNLLTPPGRPAYLLLRSQQDFELRAYTRVVPVPSQNQDRGCHLLAVPLTSTAEFVQLEGSGFAPDAMVWMNAKSSGRSLSVQGKAGSDGSYFYLLEPLKGEQAVGPVSVELRSETCTPKLQFLSTALKSPSRVGP